MTIINSIAFIIGLLGALVVIVGLLHAFWLIVNFWLKGYKHQNEGKRLDTIRIDLGRYIVLSLEFFIAKDIIETLVLPSWSEIGMLAVIVIIRTLLSFFLTKELHQIEKQKIEHRRIDAGLN